MYHYTEDNHFKFGYSDSEPYSVRLSKEQTFCFQYGVVKDRTLSWSEANQIAAKKIFDNKVGSIYILLSGGMDSEVCLLSFLQQKLPVKTISLRFKKYSHPDEMQHIERIKQQYNISHEYVDIDLESLLESSDFLSTVEPVKCVSPIIGCHLWLANQISGTPIIAQGEVHLKKEISYDYVPGVSPYLPSDWFLFESERLCSLYMNFILNKKPAIPGFFQYTPEQIYSYLARNPYLERLLHHEIHGKLGTRSSKNLILKQFYPNIQLREKLHGWENFQELHDYHRAKLAKKFPDNDASAKIKVDDLIKALNKSSKFITI